MRIGIRSETFLGRVSKVFEKYLLFHFFVVVCLRLFVSGLCFLVVSPFTTKVMRNRHMAAEVPALSGESVAAQQHLLRELQVSNLLQNESGARTSYFPLRSNQERHPS